MGQPRICGPPGSIASNDPAALSAVVEHRDGERLRNRHTDTTQDVEIPSCGADRPVGRGELRDDIAAIGGHRERPRGRRTGLQNLD